MKNQRGAGGTTAQDILKELKTLGADSYKKVLRNHGVEEPCYGVKISELKKFEKRIKTDYQLALDLYDTGVYDAMYLAGLIADDKQMTKADLQRWADKMSSAPLAGSTVPWVAAGSPHGLAMALKWIESEKELVAEAGWNALSNLVSIKPDAELDIPLLEKLLARVQKSIHQAPNKVRYAMNSFVIAAGSYVKDLTGRALEVGEKIGPVSVDMGETACKVPFAPDYIRKVEQKRGIGKKRKSAKC